VIHRWYLINQTLFNPLSPEIICLECTILHEQGWEHSSFTLKLFNIDCISAFIIWNETNLIMCQSEDLSAPDHTVLHSQAWSQHSFQNVAGLYHKSRCHLHFKMLPGYHKPRSRLLSCSPTLNWILFIVWDREQLYKSS
jgi:hypothetical protein